MKIRLFLLIAFLIVGVGSSISQTFSLENKNIVLDINEDNCDRYNLMFYPYFSVYKNSISPLNLHLRTLNVEIPTGWQINCTSSDLISSCFTSLDTIILIEKNGGIRGTEFGWDLEIIPDSTIIGVMRVQVEVFDVNDSINSREILDFELSSELGSSYFEILPWNEDNTYKETFTGQKIYDFKLDLWNDEDNAGKASYISWKNLRQSIPNSWVTDCELSINYRPENCLEESGMLIYCAHDIPLFGYFLDVNEIGDKVDTAFFEYLFYDPADSLNTAKTYTYTLILEPETTNVSSLKKKNIKAAIYPNPVGSNLIVENQGDTDLDLKLVTPKGKIILTDKLFSKDKVDFEVSVPSGVYFLVLKNRGELQIEKLIIK